MTLYHWSPQWRAILKNGLVPHARRGFTRRIWLASWRRAYELRGHVAEHQGVFPDELGLLCVTVPRSVIKSAGGKRPGVYVVYEAIRKERIELVEEGA